MTYECAIALFYDADGNYFFDSMGDIVYNLFDYITPNDLIVFKSMYEDLCIIKPHGVYVEMFYPDNIPY